jgi:hypothetical protein
MTKRDPAFGHLPVVATGATAQAHETARVQRPRADRRGAARFATSLQTRRAAGIVRSRVSPLGEWQHLHTVELYGAAEREDKGRLAIPTNLERKRYA